jgi:hypothetical protein
MRGASTSDEMTRELFLTQEGVEVGSDVGAGPVLRADDLAVDFAVARDDVGFGDHHGAVFGLNFLRWIAERRVIDGIGLEEVLIRGLVLVGADADDGTAARSDLLLQPVERGRFVNARRAPGGPEIEHDNVAAQLGEAARLAVGCELEIDFAAASEAGFALAVLRHGKKNE